MFIIRVQSGTGVITSEISAEDELELVSWMDAGDSRAKDEGGRSWLPPTREKSSIKAWDIQIGTHRVLTVEEYWMLNLNSVCKLI